MKAEFSLFPFNKRALKNMKQNLKNVRYTDIQLNNILIIISSLAIDRLSRQKSVTTISTNFI